MVSDDKSLALASSELHRAPGIGQISLAHLDTIVTSHPVTPTFWFVRSLSFGRDWNCGIFEKKGKIDINMDCDPVIIPFVFFLIRLFSTPVYSVGLLGCPGSGCGYVQLVMPALAFPTSATSAASLTTWTA